MRFASRTLAVALCLFAVPLFGQWTTGNPTTTTNTVGIGTAAPTVKLEVSGGGGAGVDFIVNGRMQTGDAAGQGGVWLDSARTLFVGAQSQLSMGLWAGTWRLIARTDTGNVGVGTTAPGEKLEVNGNIKLSGANGAVFANNKYPFTGQWLYTSDGSGYGPVFQHMLSGSGVYRPQMWLRTVQNASTLHVTSGLTLGGMDQNAQQYPTFNSIVHFGAAANDSSYINNTGAKLGIGTSTPAHALDVVGTIRATQVIGSTYQDIAEWVPAGGKLPAGTVVVVNPDEVNEVVASSEAYQTSVAGVVSAMPGIILGEAAADRVQVATYGRVKVRATAINGAIKPGDLLVSSDKSGMAMKSEALEFRGRKMHQPGTVIGKALEPLKDGEGEILVLLSLQ